MQRFNPGRPPTTGYVKKSSSIRTTNIVPTGVNQSLISQMSKQRRPISLAPVWKKD
jgi:hypothetical protein